MNIINKLTLRHMKLNKKRTLVTIIGIIIAVAMITAVSTFGYSLMDYFARNEMLTDGYFHLKFQNYYYRDNEQLMEEMDVEKYSLMKPLGDYFYKKNFDDGSVAIEPYVLDNQSIMSNSAFRIVAVQDNYYDMMPIKLISGAYPKNDNEILISESGNTFGDKKVGDKFIIGQKEYTVCGIINGDEFERRKLSIYDDWIDPIYTRLNTDCLKDNDIVSSYVYVGGILDGLEEKVEDVNSDLKNTNVPIKEFIGDGEKWFCAGFDVLYHYNVLEYYGIYDVDNVNGIMESFKLILMTIIMIGGVSLVANGFIISISERNKNIGLLASVGATKKQKRSSVYFEGFLEGIIAIPIGIVTGIGGIWLMFRIISPLIKSLSGTDTEIEVVVNSSVILGTIFFSVLTIFLATNTPAKRASAISPIDAIRQNRDIKLSHKDVKTMRITRKIFGFEGELALKNLKRHRKRYRITVISLIISLTLFISVYSIIHYNKQMLILDMKEEVCDMSISSIVDSELELDAKERLEYEEEYEKEFEYLTDKMLLLGNEYIEDYSRYYEICEGVPLYRVDVHIEENMFHSDYVEYLEKNNISGNGKITWIIAMNKADLRKYLKSIDVDYDEFVEDIDNVILYDDIISKDGFHNQYIYDGAYVSKNINKMPYSYFMLEVNSEYIEGDDTRNKYEKKVIESGEFNIFAREEKFIGLSLDDNYVLVTPKKAEQLKEYGLSARYNMALDVIDDEPIEELYNQILYDNNLNRENYDMEYHIGIIQETENTISLTSIFAYTFILLMTLICVANIVNTISTSLALRKREFAMFKSVGMTERQFNCMITYEGVFYGLKAILYGLPNGIVVSLFMRYITKYGINADLSRPWLGYVIAITGVFVVTGFTMFYSSRKIKKANIIEALRDDNA